MRTLLVTLTITLFISIAHAQSDQQLVARYDKAVAAQNYTLALKSAQEITTRYPESANWNFNLGSMLARTDDPDGAIEALKKAADLGYTGTRSFEQSEDLNPLREDERFKSILRQVQRNAQARLNEYIAEAENHKPKTHIPKNTPDSPALILALHGTGMTGTDMIDALKETADQLNMILIAPDALRPAGDGFSWTYRDESEWMVNHTITQAIEQHNIDPNQIYLVGFSQGANIALIMGQTHPNLFAGIIPICGHYEPQNASAEDSATLPPFYLLTGARDPWKKTYTHAKRDLTKSNTPVQVRMLAGKGHEIPAGPAGVKELVRAITWCQQNSTPDE
tara:strand:- start:244540 stop:245547 length:1008 start_codon:yes stop_codon:yes gene_type:complete